MMDFFYKLKGLFRLCTKICTTGLFLVCVLCVAGCTASDRAVTFNNVQTSERKGQDAGDGSAGDSPQDGVSSDSREICVYVCGEVNYPGVYSLPEDSRINDALNAAGGFTDEADQSYVNLAAKINDGDRLYFPCISESEQEKAAEEALKAGLVNINTADEALLCTLPGIGSSRAKDIIFYRESNGPFENKEDIMKVSGIKDLAYQKICDKITVGKE